MKNTLTLTHHKLNGQTAFQNTPPHLSPIVCSDRASVLQDLESDFNPKRNAEAVSTFNTFLLTLTEQYSKIVYPKCRKANLLAVVPLLSLVRLICR